MAARSAKREPVTRNVRTKTPRAAHDELRVSDVIARSLEEDIVLGRRHPREHLVEQDLCERFNTHRGDVRLALFELEKKGIIQRIPNRGAIVRDLTPKEVREIYAVREELEVMAVRILPSPSPKLISISSSSSSESTAQRSTPATCSLYSTAICIFIRCCSPCARIHA